MSNKTAQDKAKRSKAGKSATAAAVTFEEVKDVIPDPQAGK